MPPLRPLLRCATSRLLVWMTCVPVPSRSNCAPPAPDPVPTSTELAMIVLVGGLVALVVIEPRPPLKRFEVPVSNDRFAR